jgi:hypothetical protein
MSGAKRSELAAAARDRGVGTLRRRERDQQA